MERVTLERFYNDPQLLNRIYAQAHRERAAMLADFWHVIGRLVGRRLRRSKMHAPCEGSAHVQGRAVQG
jgi:hypothetical protein